MQAELSRKLWLLRNLAWRELTQRFRGSVLGLAWIYLQPIFMLVVYTFIFSVVFKVRWGEVGESKSEFAVLLFVGMSVFGFFSDCVGKSSQIIVQQPNLVKKVVFPLEVLPLSVLVAAFIQFLVNICALVVFDILAHGRLNPTALFLPLVIFPLAVFTSGVCLALAALGVFLRDVGQAVGIGLSALLFLSPVFYPLSAMPEVYRGWLLLNPLTWPIEQARAVLVLGELPDFVGAIIYGLLALLVLALGMRGFMSARPAFADVI